MIQEVPQNILTSPPNKSMQLMKTVRSSIVSKRSQTSNRNQRPKSLNQSFDFNIETSKMFNQVDLTKSKFYPLAVPSPSFDVQICKDEISRLETQLNYSEMVETQMMKNEWRTAKRSIDLQYLIDQRNHEMLNFQEEKEFRATKELKSRKEKEDNRKWKEEQFRVSKEVKVFKERENKKKTFDDLLREKNKHLQNQEILENTKNKLKSEENDKRNSYKAYLEAVRERENNDKIREIREREFDYAQNLGAKWLRLKNRETEIKENLKILNKLVK